MAAGLFDGVVIGAGINGLSAAWQLQRRGCRRVAVLERFRVGHRHGSSHGGARIARSTYDRPAYVRLVRVALAESWPALEHAAGERLVQPTPGCFFGPVDGPFEAYAHAVVEAGADVVRLDPQEGRRRFPQFRFDDAAGVLDDRTAGVIAADTTLLALTRLVLAADGQLHEDTRVEAIDTRADPLRVVTNRGALNTERLIVTAGAWLPELLPALRPALSVVRQTVGYFAPRALMADLNAGHFPVWVYLGPGENGSYYGLPDRTTGTLKVGRHETNGRNDDPEPEADGIDPQASQRLTQCLASQLAVPPEPLVHAETCLYTSTVTEDFIIDTWPDDPRIVIGSACSGHGFKFGPLTGQLLAELALDGRTSIAEFETMRGTFALSTALARASSP